MNEKREKERKGETEEEEGKKRMGAETGPEYDSNNKYYIRLALPCPDYNITRRLSERWCGLCRGGRVLPCRQEN